MEPEMIFVDSSNIDSVGYDDAALELWVRFKDGSTYVYTGVPPAVASEMLNASSKGSYLNRVVKPVYPFRRP